MEVKEALRSLLQEMILPELNQMKGEQIRITERLKAVEKRLDAMDMHLVDQSRRIDETNKRIDSVRDELVVMIGETNKRIDHTNEHINRLYEVVVRRDEHDKLAREIQEIRLRVDNLERKTAA